MKDLTSFTLSVVQELEDRERFGTAHVYRSALRAFQRYWKTRHPQEEIRMKKCSWPPRYKSLKGIYRSGCSN